MEDVEVRTEHDPAKRYIFIPIANSEEVVQISCSELPDNVQEILEILKAEYAPLKVWHRFAIEYYRHGKEAQFRTILDEGCVDEIGDIYPSSNNERVALLNTSAAFNTMMAIKKKSSRDNDEEREAKRLFDRAEDLLTKASNILWEEKSTILCKGFLHFAQGDYNRAYEAYNTALVIEKGYTPALIGKAMAACNQGKWEEALRIFKKVIEENPRVPADVRLGLAHCYHKLKDNERAKLAFQRVLDMDPENGSALAGLAVLKMNENTESVEGIQAAMTMVKDAYKFDQHNTVVLNLLANHFFFRQDYGKVHNLAARAYAGTEVKKIQAESQYQMARAFHAQQDLEQAFQCYHRAHHLWAENPLIQYGLGQMYINRGETDKAITCFETVLKFNKDSHEALKVLGHLYAQIGRTEEATANMKRVTVAMPDDAEAWVQLGELLEGVDPAGALVAYEKAAAALKKKFPNRAVPPELYNNIGSMQIILKKYKDARKSLQKALANNGSSEAALKVSDVTTVYNLGRLYEHIADTKRAKALYLLILQDHPNYYDAYVRLSCIARAQGDYNVAMAWCEEARGLVPDSADVISMIALIHYERKQYKEAQKSLESILTLPKHTHDAYSIISLANIYYKRATQTKDEAEVPKLLHKALKLYGNVLTREKNNLYAANGVAMVLAEKGKLDQARASFTAIREATADMHAVWVNMAHVACLDGQHQKAIDLYQNVLKSHFDNKEAKLLLFVARAAYESRKLDLCKSVLTRAIHQSPGEDSFWFNLGLAQKESAESILNQANPDPADLREALADLERARRIFTWMRTLTEKEPLLARHADTLERLCSSLAEAGKDQLAEADINETRRLEVMDKQRQEADQSLAAKQARKQAEEDATRAKEAELAEQAHKMHEHLTKLKETWVTHDYEQEEKDKKRARKKKEKKDSGSEEEGSDGEKKKKERKKRVRKVKAKKDSDDDKSGDDKSSASSGSDDDNKSEKSDKSNKSAEVDPAERRRRDMDRVRADIAKKKAAKRQARRNKADSDSESGSSAKGAGDDKDDGSRSEAGSDAGAAGTKRAASPASPRAEAPAKKRRAVIESDEDE